MTEMLSLYYKIFGRKMEINNCILNESLLDDVDADEVSDASPIKLIFLFGFSTLNDIDDAFKKSYESVLDRYVGSLKSSGYVNNYSFGYVEDMLTAKLFLELNDNDRLSFIHLIVHISLLLNKYSNRMDLHVLDDRKNDIINISFPLGKRSYTYLSVYPLYYDLFNIDSLDDFMKEFVPIASKSGYLYASDERNNRFIIDFPLEDNMVRMYDARGNMVSEYKSEDYYLYDSETSFNNYGLMWIKTGDDEWNYLNYDGELLLEGYNMDGIFEDICKVKRKQRPYYNYYNVVKKEFVLQEWVNHAFDFKNGIAVIERDDMDYLIQKDGTELFKSDTILIDGDHQYSMVKKYDKNGHARLNFIDCKGNIIWNGPWFVDVNSTKDGGYAIVFRVNDVTGKKESNYLDLSTGKIMSDKWFGSVYFTPSKGVFVFFEKAKGCYNIGSYNLYDSNQKKNLFKSGIFEDAEECNVLDMHFFKMKKDERLKVFIDDGRMIGDIDDWFEAVEYLGEDLWCCTVKDRGEFVNKVIRTDGTVIVDYCDCTFKKFYNNYSIVRKIVKNKDGRKFCYNLMDKDGKLIHRKWFSNIGYAKDGFIKVKDEDGTIINLISEKTRRYVFPKGCLKNINSFEIIEPGKYVIFLDNNYKYNVADDKGNFLFPEFIEDKISLYQPGLLRLGVNTIVDYDKNIVALI